MSEINQEQSENDSLDDSSTCKKYSNLNPLLRNGDGLLNFGTNLINDSNQQYRGYFFRDNFHKEGIYTQIKPNANYIYEGEIYANKYEGYARIIKDNSTYFEGLYKRNQHYGPGVLTYSNGTQDVGLWMGPSLIRLSQTVLPEWIPKLATTYLGKIKLLGHRKLIPVQKERYKADIIGLGMKNPELLYNQNVSNPDSSCFDKPAYDYTFFGNEECCIEVAISPEDILEEKENVNVSLKVQETIESLLKNVEYLMNCSKKELELIEMKCRILKSLIRHNPSNIETKKVPITDLLAWNNGEISINMLKHAFLHRNGESIVNFSVPKLLAGERKSFSNPGQLECACIAFLTYCSKGEVERAENLLKKFNINPDICDACGNNGVIYAACRDRIGMIRKLTQLGADLEFINDDCLMPLTISLTRYVSKLKDIQDWEKSFLITPVLSNELKEVNAWCPRGSFINLLTGDFLLNHDTGIFFPDDNGFFHYEGNGQKLNVSDLDWAKDIGLERIKEIEIQEFQTPFRNIDDGKTSIDKELPITLPSLKTKNTEIQESYLFHTSLNKSKKTTQKKSVYCPELLVIHNTIKTLLYYGADPNVGEIPLPVLFLTLYTENIEMLNDVLIAGANPNITYSSMTPLHFLCNMPKNNTLADMAQILVNYGADPNILTSTTHWPEEEKRILAGYPFSKKEGKTPLHVLCMRLDGLEDCELAKVLLNHASKDITYLGHTALTLAILSGNATLVKTLLQCEFNPNIILGNEMGTPLTIYALKRYANCLPNLETCHSIIETLIEFYANPLNPVYNFGNIAEFIKNQNEMDKVTSKDKKSKKNKKPKKKKGKSKKSKKSGKETVNDFLIKKCQDVAFRHYQFKVHLLLLKAIICSETLDKNFIKFLSVDEAICMHQLLINIGAINLENDLHVFLTSKILKIYQEFGFKIKSKGKKVNKKAKSTTKTKTKSQNVKIDILNSFHKPEMKVSAKRKHPEFELDHNETKYEICFHCLLKTNKSLIPCPKCELVFFCSQACNKANNRKKGRHPCKTLYYKTLADSYDGEIASFVNLPQIFKILQNINMPGKSSMFVNEFKMDSNFINPYAPTISSTTAKTKYGKRANSTYKASSIIYLHKHETNEEKGKHLQYSFRDSFINKFKSSDSKFNNSFTVVQIASTNNEETALVPNEEFEGILKNCLVRKLISGSIIPKKQIYKMRNFSRIEKRCGDQKETRDERNISIPVMKMHSQCSKNISGNWSKVKMNARKSTDENNAKELKNFNDTNTLPNKYLTFMQKIYEFFPGFDMAALFMPFVCLTDGQLFYRFLDRTPVFCPTYTNV